MTHILYVYIYIYIPLLEGEQPSAPSPPIFQFNSVLVPSAYFPASRRRRDAPRAPQRRAKTCKPATTVMWKSPQQQGGCLHLIGRLSNIGINPVAVHFDKDFSSATKCFKGPPSFSIVFCQFVWK